MSQLFTLIEIVEQLYDIHSYLLVLADRKKEILVKGDMEALNQLLQEEMKNIQISSSLENKRLQELKMIALRENIREEEITLSKLQTLTHDEQEKEKIKRMAEDFPKLFDRLKEKNDLNAMLLHQSLQYVHQTIQLLYPESNTHTYQPQDTGQYGKQSASLYDFKA